jgi:hypothetical protein
MSRGFVFVRDKVKKTETFVGGRVTRFGDFAQWVIVYFGQFSENYRSFHHFLTPLCNGKGCALTLTKCVLCHILGDIFANSSGHPGSAAEKQTRDDFGKNARS